MTSDDEDAGRARQEDARSEAARTAELPPPEAPWLLRHKVEMPSPIEGYVARPEVEKRCVLTERRLTVLHAPGGFGKTALLARCCRVVRERGTAVAWLSLDEDDGPGSVAAYLALAFERAGLETFDPSGGPSGEPDARAGAAMPEPEADSQADYRINLLIRALERHGGPCVLALDEVERLRSPEAVRKASSSALRCCVADLDEWVSGRPVADGDLGPR